MTIGSIGTNPLLFLNSRAQNAGSAASAFAPPSTNGAANSAEPLSILHISSAQPLSFANILALQSLIDEEPAQLTEMSATQKFMAEAQKTPMERMREQILEQLGLSEEALAQMSPEDRRVAEDRIRQLIEEKIKQAMNAGDAPADSNASMIEQVA
jgi:hypothetical protein